MNAKEARELSKTARIIRLIKEAVNNGNTSIVVQSLSGYEREWLKDNGYEITAQYDYVVSW